MDPRISAALGSFDFSADFIGNSQLPLLDDYRRHHARADLSAHNLLVIQHQLGTTVPLVQALIDDGIDPNRTWFVDIPYSTHPDVREALLQLAGDPTHCPALFTDPLVDYTSAQLTRVISTLFDMLDHHCNADLIVLDDGAYFLRALSVLHAISHEAARAFAGARMIEQTTRGHEFIKSHADDLRQLGIRATSIARAQTKLQFEAPFIGASVATALASKARALRPEGVSHVAVLGYGAVGEACARQLHHEFPRANMTVVDNDEEQLRAATTAHPGATVQARLAETEPRNPHELGQFDIVVGCTGRNSFTLEDRRLLAPNAILASGSSAAVEFDRAGFVDLADYRENDEVEILNRPEAHAMGIHADIRLRFERGVEVTFANAGFPVNFDGRRECLPVTAIQPTRCLMYAAVQQSLEQLDAVLHGLGKDADEWIHARGLAHLAG
ncbi:MAG TPA: NAD-binding protein [Nocardioides sp.]|uniref:NAD-binding protein n=1 Tax=Nocardioides sp. TaxID=35761 RepID=UPI002E3071D6|nr:NAD-binding protein [Nocardioides sp.]HEX5087321.1 NAD-binding protein [Nocardioides sp.]